MQQNKYCDISDHCKLLCEANKKLIEAEQYIGKTELEKERLRTQIDYLKFDNRFFRGAAKILKDTNIDEVEKLKSDIRKICTENLKYRSTMGGYIPTRPTRVLEQILNIINKEN